MRLSPLYVERQHGVHDRRPTVHVEDLAGNEARFIHAKKHHGVADIFGRGQPAHRGPAALVPGTNCVLNLLRQNAQDAALNHAGRAENAPWADTIDSDITWG